MPKRSIKFLCFLSALSFISLLGCQKEYGSEIQQELIVDKQDIVIHPDSTITVKIEKGNGGYAAYSSNDTIVSVTINQDNLILKARKNIHYGQAFVLLTDQKDQKIYLNIEVKDVQILSINKDSIHFTFQQARDTIHIIEGNKPYMVEISDSSIVRTKFLNDTTILIIAKQNGSSIIHLQDGANQTKEIPINVNGSEYAFDFGSSYFGFANFKDIAVVDPDYTKCTQLTYEITCKLTGYRGLQTIMGLENNLIMRGKNDDYKATHPIEIAGLNDAIMLETTSSIPLNQWIHLALVVDCNQETIEQKYKFYINGVEDKLIINRQEKSHTIVDLASSGDGNRFEIGRSAGQDFRAMQGAVSMARVWKTARTQDQLKTNICSILPSVPQGLVANWNFSAGVSTYYLDDINNGKYSTALHFSNVAGGGYSSILVPAQSFIQKGCPQ